MMNANENAKSEFKDVKVRKLILPAKEAGVKRAWPGLTNPTAQEEQLKDVKVFKARCLTLGPAPLIAKGQKIGSRAVEPKKEESAASNCSLDEVEDIDADDGRDLILMSEYVNDIYNYLYELEEQQPIHLDRLNNQLEVTVKMRAKLIDRINKIHDRFHLEIESFYLTVAIIDRYLQVEKTTTGKSLQLVGATALLIATKYEELFPPTIADIVDILGGVYKGPDIKKMELQILRAIDGNLSRPLPIQFLRRFAKAAKVRHEHYAMAKYFLELSCVDYELASYKPSLVAAATLSLALHLLDSDSNTVISFFNNKYWTPTLVHYSRYTVKDLRVTKKQIAKLACNAPTGALKAIYTKYQSDAFLKIALRPELSSTLMASIAGKR